MKICVAGQGAFGQKHLDALKRIPDVEITSLVGGNQDSTAQIAKKYGIPHYTGELSEGIKRADAVILTTPTKMHFRQGEQVMRAGKHDGLLRSRRRISASQMPRMPPRANSAMPISSSPRPSCQAVGYSLDK